MNAKNISGAAFGCVILLTLQACDLQMGGGDDYRPYLNPEVPESIREAVAQRMSDKFGFNENESKVSWRHKGPNTESKGEHSGGKTTVPFMRGVTDIEVRNRAGVRNNRVRAGDYSWILEQDGSFRFGGYPMNQNGYLVKRNEQARIKYLGSAHVRGEDKTINQARLEYDIDFAKREGSGVIGEIPKIGLKNDTISAWGESRSLKLAKAKLEWKDFKAYIKGAVDAGLESGPDIGYSVVVMGPEAQEIAGTLYLKNVDSGQAPDIFGGFLGERPYMR